MTMTIHKQMVDEGPALFYNPSFRATLETHLSLLREHKDTDFLTIESYPAHKYEYDFYGLLSFYKVEPKYHWLILRMNEMTSPPEYTSDITAILIPSNAVVGSIVQAYRTSNKNN